MTQTDELIQELLKLASEEGVYTGFALKRAAGRIAELEAENERLKLDQARHAAALVKAAGGKIVVPRYALGDLPELVLETIDNPTTKTVTYRVREARSRI